MKKSLANCAAMMLALAVLPATAMNHNLLWPWGNPPRCSPPQTPLFAFFNRDNADFMFRDGGKIIHEMREMMVMGCGQYAHGNQPIQHMIYLYDWTDEPWKTQYWAREAMNRLYKPTPDGYCGDEDNGQTSAWFVWSALGMYPVCPASGEYALGAPLFERTTVTFPDGRRLVVSVPGVTDRKRYAKRVSHNGMEHDQAAN